MSDLPPEDTPLAAVGRYPRFSQAQERGLVAAAMDLPYWVVREGPTFVLYVEESAGQSVAAELEKFELEQAQRAATAAEPPPDLPKLETISLFVVAALMSAFWSLQQRLPENIVNKGASEGESIMRGEWWRTITGLTLHGDFSHFIANLGFGLLFGAFLQPRLGGGIAWLGIVICGALGNAVNAWFYRQEPHITIGASTAVFGGLGLLMAWEFVARWRSPHTRHRWQLVVPLGGGLALLAYLGSGGEGIHRTDYMAHFFGFVAGAILGLVAAIFPRATPRWQWAAATTAVVLLVGSWWLALRAS